MIKHIYIMVLAMMLLASSGAAKAQDVALKTNLLGWATTSLNAGVEVGIAEKQTAQLFATLNPWEFSGGKKVAHLECGAGIPLVDMPALRRQLLRSACSCRRIQRQERGPSVRHPAQDEERTTL